MDLMEELDPEEARAIVDPALKLMIDAVHRYDGYIVQSTGDGIFALFGAPVAHEDHPQRALYAALRMQEEMRVYAERLRAERGINLQVRVGVNTGEMVVRSIQTGEGHTEYTPIGHSTGLAARLQTLANPGAVVVSESVRRLAEGYFQLKALGPARIRGVNEPVEIFEITGLGPLRTRLQVASRRGLTKFVGREREMETLGDAGGRAKAGHGQIVASMAEAGTGKSRLFFEFKAKNQSGWMVLEAFSVSHGKASAYLPVIDLLHGYFGIDADDERTRREKVAGKVTILDRSLEDALPYLFGLLGIVEGEDPLAQMDGQIKRRRTLDAIKRILLRESMNQPLMVIFEDLHWIDEQTQALLNLLADSIGTAKILLLVNYRPEYSHQWGSKTYYTQLRLDPLGKESADEMLLALLGDGRDLEPLKRVIIEKTEGNPFFMEETVQVLLDEGALVRDGGAVKLTRPVSELKIPPTVQGILAARIDRLAPDTKELLQTLSVIGREFPMSLIRAVVQKSDDELNRMLGDLQLGEFIYEQPAVGDTQYIFKHALTQEVSHNSVLLERRRPLHERIGGAIETVFTENLEDHLVELAHHYSRSANRAKALEFLHRAGEQAIGRASYFEAESYFAAALEAVPAMPESAERDKRELRLRSSFAQALGLTKGSGAPELLEMSLRARALAKKTGNLPELVQQLWVAARYAIARGDYFSAAALAAQVLETAQREGSPISLGLAHQLSLSTRFFLGDFVAAEEHFARGRAFVEAPGFPQIGVLALVAAATFGHGSWNAWITGHADAARERDERMRRVQEGTQRNPFVTACVQIMTADLHAMLREFARAEALAAEALASAEEHGFPDAAIWSRIPLGLARAELGRTAEGIALLRQALADSTEWGSRFEITWPLTYLAKAQALDGAVADALRTIDDASRANPQELFLRPETLRVRGELRLREGDIGLAEADFREAISLAQKMSAKAWELRATTSLARLLRDNNRRDEARAMLAEIYNWFTEGFDTADLKDAKALLQELGA